MKSESHVERLKKTFRYKLFKTACSLFGGLYHWSGQAYLRAVKKNRNSHFLGFYRFVWVNSLVLSQFAFRRYFALYQNADRLDYLDWEKNA